MSTPTTDREFYRVGKKIYEFKPPLDPDEGTSSHILQRVIGVSKELVGDSKLVTLPGKVFAPGDDNRIIDGKLNTWPGFMTTPDNNSDWVKWRSWLDGAGGCTQADKVVEWMRNAIAFRPNRRPLNCEDWEVAFGIYSVLANIFGHQWTLLRSDGTSQIKVSDDWCLLYFDCKTKQTKVAEQRIASPMTNVILSGDAWPKPTIKGCTRGLAPHMNPATMLHFLGGQ
jgi:hypothetical protein